MRSQRLPDRLAVAGLSAITNLLWGVRANLVGDVVAEHGSVRALAWFCQNMPRYELIRARWGPIRTHLICAVLSLDNGCTYATYGHARSLQLHYFRAGGRLFPLSDSTLLALSQTQRDTLVAEIDQAVAEAGLHDERPWVRRALEIKDGASVRTSADADLRRLADMFQWLNSVGIRAGTDIDEAHDPINKDSALRARYVAARAASD